VLRTAFEATY